MPHKMGKHLAIDMLAQAPRVESSDTPAVLPGGDLESGCSSNGQRMAVGQFFRVPFSCAASLFPGDTRLVSRGINFEFRSTQVKRFQQTWQVGEDSLFQTSTSIIPNPCDKWYSTCLKTITPKKHMVRNNPTCCWFCHCSFSISEFLTELLNSGTNRPVLAPKKTATISATAIGPLWSDGATHGDQQGSWGTSRLRMVTGYRPSMYMVLGRDSLFALSLNQCHHCPEKIDKTWHNTSFLAEQILERRYFWAKPKASLPNQSFSGKPAEISPTDARKHMRGRLGRGRTVPLF